MARPAIAVALPPERVDPVAAELRAAGFTVVTVEPPATSSRRCSTARATSRSPSSTARPTSTESLEYYALLRDAGRPIPALMVVSPRTLDELGAGGSGSVEDEYFTRPYSAESLRWRVEAMCIRSQTVDDGSGPDPAGRRPWRPTAGPHRATIIAVFNPKGGVGKTTVATNLASALQIRKGQNVLLVDADTVTGHVTTSLGIDGVRTVADSWRDEPDGGPIESLADIARRTPSGMQRRRR